MLGFLHIDYRKILSKNYFTSILLLVKISLKQQYKGSFLGMAWSLIQPAMFILIMSAVFSTIMRFPVKDFTLFLASGTLAWNFIVNSLTISANSIVTREHIFKRIALPKTMFIFADVLVQIWIFFVAVFVLEIISLILTKNIHLTSLLLPIAALPLIISVGAASIALAYIAVYLRDVSYLLTVLLNALYWTVPIVYPMSVVPEDKRVFFEYNPFYILIKPIREVLYYGNIPSVEMMIFGFGIASIVIVVSLVIYKVLRKNVIYYL
jgi:lipopolysaccharide transport system permease protein